jgi:cell division protein FtsN
MTRDQKEKPARKSKGMSWMSLTVGILTGVVVGLGIALAVAWYVNKMPNPFASKSNGTSASMSRSDVPKPESPKGESARPSKVEPKADAGADSKTPGKTDPKLAKNEEGKPRFDFYKILPGAEETLSDQDLKRSEQKPAASKDVYFLQAGAFQSAADADNMKARLALMGMEAAIQTVAVPDKGMLHRVRVGPFGSLDELNKARNSLKDSGVQSTPIKVSEGPAR